MTAEAVTGTATLASRLKAFEGKPAGPPLVCPDEVNLPMIRHWCEAIGDRNPIYLDPAFASRTVHRGLVAPPTMLQAWRMPGFVAQVLDPPPPSPEDAGAALEALLDAEGYTATVATNSEQRYRRYLRPKDRLTVHTVLESVSEEKSTAIGDGFFVTRLSTYLDQRGEEVATMRFRLLRFKPRGGGPPGPQPPPGRPRPVVNEDNAFFWEGLGRGRLLLQRCSGCGALRYPPRPMCPGCTGLAWEPVAASGRGTVYSYVVVHRPRTPGFEHPYVVALVELEEGPRVVSNLLGVDPGEVRIGMPVEADFVEVDGQVLHQFRPAGTRPPPAPQPPPFVPRRDSTLRHAEATPGLVLPELRVEVTRSLVVAAAIASRDYEPIHHDPDVARARGLRDVSMNILSLNGLVGRYVTDWAGPDAVLEEVSIRLGAQAYPGDALRFTGSVTERSEDAVTVAVQARVSLGDAVTGTVRLRLPKEGR